MNTVKAYAEVIEFIAAGTSPGSVIAFRPSEAAKMRVAGLVQKEKAQACLRMRNLNWTITCNWNI